MEDFILKALKGAEGDVVAETYSTSLSFEFGGSIIMKRGTFEQRIYFFARVYETKHKGVFGIDDWDVNDVTDIKLDGLPISEVHKTKQKVEDLGMKSLADRLGFTQEEHKIAICQCMLRDEQLKLLYGKKFKVWDLLSVDEQRLLDLQFVVENYKGCGENLKNQVATHYKIGVQPTTPTLEEFELKLAELSK
jgi:hypothetical protein